MNGNVQPFTNVESHFVDVRFFNKDNAPKKTMPSIITFMGRGGTKNILQTSKEDIPKHQLKKEESQEEAYALLPSKVDTINPRVHP